MKPKCIIVTGRPGSGKTTLSHKLADAICLPLVSRDEIKEGYVHTRQKPHDQLSSETNGIVNKVFFDSVLSLLNSGISLVIEAAFQHKLWQPHFDELAEAAEITFVICDVPAETAAKRHLERGLANPKRQYFHGDHRVAEYRRTGTYSVGADYHPPQFDAETIFVNTQNGYNPSIDELESAIIGESNEA